jgi:hypothetical protein
VARDLDVRGHSLSILSWDLVRQPLCHIAKNPVHHAAPALAADHDQIGSVFHLVPDREVVVTATAWTHASPRLNNLLTGRAPKGEQTAALDAELVLSAAEGARGGVVLRDVPVFRRCPACDGTGGEWMYPCSTCEDRGVVEGEARLRVSIPPRAPDGVVLEVLLQQAGIHNLLVRLRLRVDPRF